VAYLPELHVSHRIVKRTLPVVVVVAVVACAVVLWKCRGGSDSDAARTGSSTAGDRTASTANAIRAKPDPRTLDRASIAGTITDDTKAPVPHARVCATASSHELPADVVRDPRCANADDAGRYELRDLLAAEYAVAAMAKPYRPGTHHPGGDRKRTQFHLAAGEHKTGVDVELLHGGVEVTGTVADITGGPVPHATVRETEGWWGNAGEFGVAVDADDGGKFSLWVRPGQVAIIATADGYAPGSADGHAPGKFEILLTPESSLSGTVVDATTNQPIEGARVLVKASDSWGGDTAADITNAQGKFRVNKLVPGRYVAEARTAHGYGRTEGSTRVGLGQHADGGIVRVFPAHRIEGKIVIGDGKKPCVDGHVWLRDAAQKHWLEVAHEPDGTQHAEGVIAGTYLVSIDCPGYQSHDKYDSIKVADKDVTGIEWPVEPGATIRGRITSKSGAPIADAEINARTTGGAARDATAWGGDRSKQDGDYELTGLRAGSYRIYAETDQGVGPREGFAVDVAAGATVTKDLVLDDAGTIKGTVVDADGKPIGGVTLFAQADEGMRWFGQNEGKSDDAGNFQLSGLRAGSYRVTAQHGWNDALRKPGTTDDAKQGERVVVKPAQVASLRLTVEAQNGTIKGTAIDADGKPVTDAYVSAARESDAAGAEKSAVAQTRWSWDERPVVTGTDGSFALTKLSPGNYTLRAYRKGGGEAVLEHVAVNTTTKLQFRPTGAIEGTAVRKGGGAPTELDVTLHDLVTGFRRNETYYMTSGHFIVQDLPAGQFKITVEAEGGHKTGDVALADGERKTGVDFELDALLSIAGRLVELGTTKPVAGMHMSASLAQGRSFVFNMGGDDRENISDDSGRFTIKDAPQGKLAIRGFPKDFDQSDYTWVYTVKTITGSGTVDVGDIGVVKKRVKPGDPVGELGIKFQQFSESTPPEEHLMKVSYIDPNGPAAKTDLKVGDVITTVDGVDVAGVNYGNAWPLMRAPPGTALKLGLQRGATVTVVLAPPS
jgi:protocatechuate 3,4-dioxygenase beta subunit